MLTSIEGRRYMTSECSDLDTMLKLCSRGLKECGIRAIPMFS